MFYIFNHYNPIKVTSLRVDRIIEDKVTEEQRGASNKFTSGQVNKLIVDRIIEDKVTG